MILLDYSAVSFASILAWLPQQRQRSVPIEIGQHLILNSIRQFIKTFDGEFGYPVICCDFTRNSWRKKIFKHYKTARGVTRDESYFDWQSIFDACTSTRKALESVFPVYIAEKEGYEADDIIAAFALSTDTPTMICSEDKDFYQLLSRPNIGIFHNRRKEIYHTLFSQTMMKSPFWQKLTRLYKVEQVSDGFAQDYLLEHIVRGDAGDGVPNFLSDDDCFINREKKQVPIYRKRMPDYKTRVLTNGAGLPEEDQRRIARNRALIDLSDMPTRCADVVDRVPYQNKPQGVNTLITQRWLIENTLTELSKHVQDFYPKVTDTSKQGLGGLMQ